MARRMFTVVDVTELLRHWYAGDSVSEMARALGLDRKTVRKYVARAQAAGLSPKGPPISRAEWAERVRAWCPELSDPRARSSVHGRIAAHHDYIEKHLETNTLSTIHQRLRDERGLSVSRSSLRRYVLCEFAERAAAERATVLRDDPPPGEEAQLDYGHLGSWSDPESGMVRRVWAFIMTLAFSRHLFCYPVLRMTQEEFLAAHVAAFAFFGGIPRRLVPDNLGSGILKADLYDPRLNHGYAELAWHYGCLVDPARAAHPKDKARVERVVPYVRDSFFCGQQFVDLASMRSQAASWSSRVAGERACRPLGGARPIAIFRALEAEQLLALPANPFEAAIARLVCGLLAEQALHRLRSAQGIIRLADTHGAQRLEAACALALEVGDPAYRTVKGILAAGRERLEEEPAPVPAGPAHLHGPATLFAHLEA